MKCIKDNAADSHSDCDIAINKFFFDVCSAHNYEARAPEQKEKGVNA